MENKLFTIAMMTARLRHLGATGRWLRRLARSGQLPAVRIGRELRFDPEAVESALARLAAQGDAFVRSPATRDTRRPAGMELGLDGWWSVRATKAGDGGGADGSGRPAQDAKQVKPSRRARRRQRQK